MASVFEQIGGKPAVSAAVDGLYARLLSDSLLAAYFDGVDMGRQKRHMRAFMAVALGGSELYAGRDMRAAHAHMLITDHIFDRVVGHLVDTLTSLGVPTETIAAIGAKLEPLRAQIVTVQDMPEAA